MVPHPPGDDRARHVIGLTPFRIADGSAARANWSDLWDMSEIKCQHGGQIRMSWYMFVADVAKQVRKIEPARQRVQKLDMGVQTVWEGAASESGCLRVCTSSV